jgi:hypothetical protein
LISDQGDIAVIIEEQPDAPGQYFISAYKTFDSDSLPDRDLAFNYLSACDPSMTEIDFSQITYESSSDLSAFTPDSISSSMLPLYTLEQCADSTDSSDESSSTFVVRKYKPVAKKVRPLLADLSDKYRITRNIVGNPLSDMLTLNANPPDFTPTGQYTAARRDIIDKVHSEGFLLPAERALMHDFMSLQNKGFAWDDSECGRFCEDFFPPVMMPVV